MDKLVPPDVAAKRLGVAERWLKLEISEGRIPSLHAGRKTLVDVFAVERLLLERARTPPVPVPVKTDGEVKP